MSGGPRPEAATEHGGAHRGEHGGIDWSLFLRGMADEIDAVGGATARDTLLRHVGHRIAVMRPVGAAPNMETLAMEMNDQLAAIGWGMVGIVLSERDRSLLITHSQLPRIGAAGDPPGTWLSAMLEGLYEGWLAQLPGSDPAMVVRRMRITPQTVLLRYGRTSS
jgi:hypothetical protein